MALQPTVTSNGIKYIKINKQDFNGTELNTQINGLAALRIQYSDGTITQFNLIGEPSEYPDYYLLRVSPSSPYTSSLDNTILNYTALGSKGFSSIPISITKISGFTVSSNPGGYFNGTTGNYTVPNLTNIPIQITGSFQVEETAGSTADVELELVSSAQGTLASNSVTLGALGVDTLLVQYSGVFTEGELIYFNWVRQGSADNTGVSSITFTQSQSPNAPLENLIIFEPYNTSNFSNSDYNAIINNALINRPSTEYQIIDYTTNQNVPVNFEQILTGTATRASIQDSNYTSYQYSGIRYWGSKNTTDDFNSSLTSQSQVVQTYQNDDLGITTLGYPSVNNYDTGIYEFAWGGGTYPEIAGGGAVKLSQILNVDSTSSVGIISPLTNYFASVVAQDLVPNSLPQFTQYSTTSNIPNTARVMTTDFGVPTISSYMISSDVTTITAGFGGNSTLTFANSASRVSTNSSGYYITGSAILNTVMATEISNSLAGGDQWFVTLYQNLPNPVQGTLSPLNSGSLNNYSIITNGNYNNPVLYNGVFEISSSIATGTPTLYLYNELPVNSGFFGNGGYGMLIWKAITDGTFVLFNGATLSGVGKGNLITNTASPTIKDNLTYITTTFGTN